MKRFYKRACPALIFLGICAVFLSACKTKPEVSTNWPSAILSFVSIEAIDTAGISLDFTLTIVNPVSFGSRFVVEGGHITINGNEIKANGAELAFSGLDENKTFSVDTGSEDQPGIKEIPVRLELDVPALISAGVPLRDDFTVELVLDLALTDNMRISFPFNVSETVVFPYIREPVFSITAIAILKAELINTRFRVGLRIENPNHFPVDLSAFGYTLYGNGNYWANGTERNIIRIAPKSTITGDLYLIMNFIDMPRSLLDQIIRLENVNYRFNGEAMVSTGVDYLPRFVSSFDLSGYSEVFDN